MNCGYCISQIDNGPNPYAINIDLAGKQNKYFRNTIWTGHHLQMTLMCIPPYEDIGIEIHEDTDQFVRIEQGKSIIKIGINKDKMNIQQNLCKGDAVFIPAGTWHNIINTGKNPLNISSIYAPPHHPKGTIHYTKADAQRKEYY